MTARQIATLKANWDERDPAEQADDVYDTIINPQDAVTFAAGITASTTLAVTGATTLTGAVTANGALTASGTFTASQPIVLSQGLDRSDFFQVFDDFTQQTLTEADGPWIENSGTHAVAADPAINAQANGVVRLATGTADGTVASNGSQLVGHMPVRASYGNLFFETRLHVNTNRTNLKLNAGFTDATTLELPYQCTGTAYSATATDAAVFLFDSDSTAAGSWHTVAVDTGVEDHGNDAISTAPTAGTYQVLRIEISPGGGTCWYYINDTQVGKLSHAGVTPTANLYPTVIASSGSWSQKTVDIDYITFGHTRA